MSGHWVVEGLGARLDGFELGPVDLALTPGSAVAVLGRSGAGKTTLLRTLAGFVKVRSGRLLRDGTDISNWLPEERALGYVPQGLGLLPHRTVEGNVYYPMEIRGRPDGRNAVRELLARFGLTPLAKRYPSRLSGGEQQRVALARALAADPELIVWDEPWQGLDVVARYDLAQVLHELREVSRIPVVIVTHDPALAFSVADSFLVLDGGRARRQCDARELLRAPADPFCARFVGFENVFDPAVLEAEEAGSFRSWLRVRSGPEGVAFASPSPASSPAAGPAWSGVVRSARPSPHGILVEVVVDGLVVTLLQPPPGAPPFPRIGDRVAFGLDPEAVQPLGGRFTSTSPAS